MSQQLDDLLCEHGAASFQKHFFLNTVLGDDHEWGADLDGGEITLGPHTWKCQMLGSESEAAESWLWAWANNAGYSSGVLRAAELLRDLGQRNGIPEFTERNLAIESAGGHVLSAIAAGVCGGNAYYRGPNDGGAAFLLIQDPTFPPMPAGAGEDLVRVFPAFFQHIEVPDHREAFAAYASQRKLAASQSGNAIRVKFPTGEEVVAQFDSMNRLTSLHLK